MLLPNMTTDFPFFAICLVFYLFPFFCWCLWQFPVSAVKLSFSVAAFVFSVSLTIIDASKSSSWVVLCCTSLWLESKEHWILSNISWLLTLLHSTTTFSHFANYCSKEWITSSLFFNCSLRNIISSCNCFIKRSEFSAKTSFKLTSFEIQCLFLKE